MTDRPVPPVGPPDGATAPEAAHAEQERVRLACAEQRRRAAHMREVATEQRAQTRRLRPLWRGEPT